MDQDDFEGTLVLEKMAEIGKLDQFFEAIDNDDFQQVIRMMKRARIDSKTISMLVQKMKDADGSH